jgi:glycosyltransferase involved in cell wall biosynthesis
VVENLQRAGVEVVLLCEQKSDRITVEWHRLLPLGSPVSFLRNILATRRLAKDVDVVHALDGWPFGVYGYAGVLGTSKKLFINGVGTYSVAPLYSPWIGSVVRRAYQATEGIFCISAHVKNQLLRAGVSPDKLIVVHLGSDKLPALSQEEEEKYRNELSIDRRRFPVILTVGDIKNRKGQLDTLQAIGRLKEKYPQILYIAVGTSNLEYIKDMHAYAESHGLTENFRTVSSIDDKKLSFLYSVCTLVALNSNSNEIGHHFEGFGLIITEGYQFGKPAVGSRDCGIEDAIEDGKTGLLANQGDPLDIAVKIEQVLENLQFFSHNARMRYALFDWRNTVSAYIAAYRK